MNAIAMNKSVSMATNFVALENDAKVSWTRVEEVRREFRESVSGVRLEKHVRSAIISVPTEDVADIVAMWAQDGIPGRIYVTEMVHADLPSSFTIDPDDKVRDISKYEKIAGDTKIPCTLDGEQIYRFAKYDPSGLKEDTLIQHDNGDAIRKVSSQLRKALQANTDFDKPDEDEFKEANLGAAPVATKEQLAEAKKNATKPIEEPV